MLVTISGQGRDTPIKEQSFQIPKPLRTRTYSPPTRPNKGTMSGARDLVQNPKALDYTIYNPPIINHNIGNNHRAKVAQNSSRKPEPKPYPCDNPQPAPQDDPWYLELRRKLELVWLERLQR